MLYYYLINLFNYIDNFINKENCMISNILERKI